MSWQKYIKNKGINLGINKFGESAPYKKLFENFKMSEKILQILFRKS